MSNLSQFGGGAIKNRYAGSIAITGVATTATATITAVDVSKCVLHKLGERGSATDAASFFCTLSLTNTTTITAQRAGNTTDTTVNYQLVEYY